MFLSMGDKPTAFLNSSTRATYTVHYILPDSIVPPLTGKLQITKFLITQFSAAS